MSGYPKPFRHDAFAGLIGVARVDITPPVGIYCRNWGAARHDAAEGIHRPLVLTALTLQTDQQEKPLVFVDADASWWRNMTVERKFRQRLLEQLELDSAHLIFGLTHTHAAVPLTDEQDPGWEGGELLAPYLEKIYQATVEAVTQAVDTAQLSTLDWHLGRCQLATMRDLVDPEPASNRRLCGFNPSTEADDTLLVGRVTDTQGRPVATLCNYACHPTTLAWDNKLISPDYIGAMRETVERGVNGAPALFMQAASGELGPRQGYVGDTEVADRHGQQLGYSVLATLADMEPPGQQLVFGGSVESGAVLAVWKHQEHVSNKTLSAHMFTVDLPLKDWPSADELEQQLHTTEDRALQERLRRKRNLRRSLGDSQTFALPVWIWTLGDALLVGTMAEAYSWIQQHLRTIFPDRTIAYMNLINGSIGYLPPAGLYDEDIYQVWQTPFERGSLERLGEAIEEAITRTVI
jgi:hypothetical protein